jgi:hypothetical protein
MLEGFKKRKERRDLSFPPLCGEFLLLVPAVKKFAFHFLKKSLGFGLVNND